MDQSLFQQFLRRQGKKAHVIEELVKQVQWFEVYLAEEKAKKLETAVPQDLLDYATALNARQPGSSGKSVRGVALYYHFTCQAALTATANDIREQITAKTRRVFPLIEFRGVNPQHIEKVAAHGIVNVDQMLAAGATPADRQQLMAETAVPPKPS